jgi:hypothetical protein
MATFYTAQPKEINKKINSNDRKVAYIYINTYMNIYVLNTYMYVYTYICKHDQT